VDYFGCAFGSLVSWGDRRHWRQPDTLVAGCCANRFGRQSFNWSKDNINRHVGSGSDIFLKAAKNEGGILLLLLSGFA
jgi:hypothetical protein